jgi:hypothetical protein
MTTAGSFAHEQTRNDRPFRLFRRRKKSGSAAKAVAMGDLSRRQKQPDRSFEDLFRERGRG